MFKLTNKEFSKLTLKDFNNLMSIFEECVSHLEYCGYGDSWERSGAEQLINKVESLPKIFEKLKN